MQKFIIPHIHSLPCTITISGQDARHIFKVLRRKPGNMLDITDGSGSDFCAEIKTCSAKAVEIEVTATRPSTTESPLKITLCCGMLKDKKMDLIIKQATQLGISRWMPFYSKRSVPKPSDRIEKKIQRWETIARESLKQCRRSRVPEILAPLSFEKMLQSTGADDLKIVFWENESFKFKPHHTDSPVQSVSILIGPEGGFSKDEIDQAVACGFQVLAMGPRILRAETAAVSACTLIQHQYGDI